MIGNLVTNDNYHDKYFQYAITSFISNILIKSQDARELGRIFLELDADKNGKLDRDEFSKSALIKESLDFMNAENLNDLFDRIDTNNNGTIEYSEFITASMNRSM